MHNPSEITVHDKIFIPFISAETLQEKIQELAAQLNQDYAGKQPLFIAILNGSFMFAADVFRQITIEAEICFIRLSSYTGTTSTGQVITAIGLDVPLSNRPVIILEDIVDTGKTLSEFLPQIQLQQPASVAVAALLHKPDATRFPVPIQYCCFSIANKFVLGYGLDYNGLGRNLPGLYQLKEG